MRSILVTAMTTGVFCAGFAMVVDAATDMLNSYQVAVMGAISGFLGSLFANLIWRRRK